MIARFRSWWKNTSKTSDTVIILSLVILFVLLVLIILGYIFNWPWTGLHGRTLYDWLQLLIIPAVLALVGYLFNFTTSRNEQKATKLRAQTEREAAEKQAQTERDVALDNQHEAALQAYIDSMSELLLEKNLRLSLEDAEVRKIARVRTLTVLPRLDNKRKATVLQFLQESRLIDTLRKVVDLSGANLNHADLVEANLSNANLVEADLIYADLTRARLVEADLSNVNLGNAKMHHTDLRLANLRGAFLHGADLRGALYSDEQLKQASSLEGAILRDGTTHP